MANFSVFNHSMDMNIQHMKDAHMMAVVDAKVTNFVRLPLSECRGTEVQRYKKAQEYSDKLAKKLDKISEKKSCTTVDFVQALKSILSPQEINFSIKTDVQKGTSASIGREFDFDKKYDLVNNCIIEKTDADIVGYKVNLKLKNKDMIIDDKVNALHESRHLFDYICNPKTIQFRSFNFLFDNEKLDTYKKTYDLLVNDYLPFRSLKSIKKEVLSNFSKMSNEDIINTLQSVRNGIKTEKNAYKDCDRYMLKHPIRYAYDIFANRNYIQTMKFDKKLKFVNELLAEKIKTERALLKEKYSK